MDTVLLKDAIGFSRPPVGVGSFFASGLPSEVFLHRLITQANPVEVARTLQEVYDLLCDAWVRNFGQNSASFMAKLVKDKMKPLAKN